MTDDIFKIAVPVPADYLDLLMDSLDVVIEPIYPGYRRCFSISDVISTWIPTVGSKPFIGDIDRISFVTEKKLEFAVKASDLSKVLHIIENTHPYEEPAVDVIPMKSWRSFLNRSQSILQS